METLLKKPLSILPLLLLAIFAFFPRTAEAQEEGYAFSLSNFSLELLGGYTGLNPKDLNAVASYEEAYLQYYYVTRFNYYRSLYGDGYRVTNSRNDNARFTDVTGGPSYGFRLRYNLSPTLGLSIGIQFLNRTKNSNVAMNVDVMDSTHGGGQNIGALSYQYQNPGFLLSFSAWSPQLAAHFGWNIGQALRLELLVAGGPLYAECRTVSERRTASTDQTGFRSETVYAVEMKGEAKGLSGELGGRAGLRLTSFLSFFVEGVFAFRAADEVQGTGWSRTVISDSNGSQAPVTASWNGRWTFIRQNVTADWGRFQENLLQNQIEIFGFGSNFQKFMIDLSGFQIKAGLSFRI
jgi:hypothetical protein